MVDCRVCPDWLASASRRYRFDRLHCRRVSNSIRRRGYPEPDGDCYGGAGGDSNRRAADDSNRGGDDSYRRPGDDSYRGAGDDNYRGASGDSYCGASGGEYRGAAFSNRSRGVDLKASARFETRRSPVDPPPPALQRIA